MGPVSFLPKHQKLSTSKGDLAKMTHLQAGLSPETIEKARLELNENPDVLHQDIQQVRDMIITRPDIGFLRTDDAFILRFLRARKFHQADAFRLLAQYFQYRQLNLDMFKNFKADDPGIKRALIDGFPGVLENRDHYGRKILLLFAANWDQTLSLHVWGYKPLWIMGSCLNIYILYIQASQMAPVVKNLLADAGDINISFFGKVVFINIHPNPVSVRFIPLLTYFHLSTYNRNCSFLEGNRLYLFHVYLLGTYTYLPIKDFQVFTFTHTSF
ncbi:hypothetical protein FD755_016644, partial [Muntiacus reevesi]